jgi:hypothetical protein
VLVGHLRVGLFTLQGKSDRLLELLQFLCKRQIALRGHALTRHCGVVCVALLSLVAVVGDAHSALQMIG